jgi:hypothetical protein
MTIMISDIDNTLCPQDMTRWHVDTNRTKAFAEHVLGLLPFDWVVERGIAAFKQAREVIFVTGRGIHLNVTTALWVQRNLGIDDFRIVNTPYHDAAQYVADKEAALETCITECVQGRIPCEMIHVIEDDPVILDFLVAMANGIDAIIVEFGIEGEVDDGETVDDAYAKAVAIVEEKIASKIASNDVKLFQDMLKRKIDAAKEEERLIEQRLNRVDRILTGREDNALETSTSESE